MCSCDFADQPCSSGRSAQQKRSAVLQRHACQRTARRTLVTRTSQIDRGKYLAGFASRARPAAHASNAARKVPGLSASAPATDRSAASSESQSAAACPAGHSNERYPPLASAGRLQCRPLRFARLAFDPPRAAPRAAESHSCCNIRSYQAVFVERRRTTHDRKAATRERTDSSCGNRAPARKLYRLARQTTQAELQPPVLNCTFCAAFRGRKAQLHLCNPRLATARSKVLVLQQGRIEPVETFHHAGREPLAAFFAVGDPTVGISVRGGV